ncbi:MAG: hypothetical protein A4E64_01185 [Syntrophorhabdus sp. PtaU1.Bin058]|nr:MAG: hypothetical protein A4E64_01185 [Syntrophorhabdus sp. PtaU1.Bin058]
MEPRDANILKPIRLPAPQYNMAFPMVPLWEIKAVLPGRGPALRNVALRPMCGRMTPLLPGPITLIP